MCSFVFFIVHTVCKFFQLDVVLEYLKGVRMWKVFETLFVLNVLRSVIIYTKING